MNNWTTFQLKARVMLCTSLAVLLAACGGGSDTDTSQTMPSEFLKSANANPGSNGYEGPTTTATTTTTAPTTTTPAPAPGPNDLYVATTGSDSNSGTQAAPFRTIAKAASVATAGISVHVAPGTYTGSISFSTSGTATARIRFVSDVKWGAKIVGMFQPRGNYVTIENFELTNPSGSQGIETYGSYTNIIGNKIHSIPGGCPSYGGAGIHTYQDQDNLIENNVVYDIGNFNGVSCQLTQGIYLEGIRDTVRNNLVYHTQGWGIHMWHGATRSTIVNNTVVNNLVGGIMIGAGDADATINDYTNVANNIVSFNGSLGGRYGISEDGVTGTHNVYTNNLVYGNLPGNTYLLNGLQPVAGITADPQFVSYTGNSSGDYHLKSTSPAIGTGSMTNAPTTDLDGVLRGTPMDIGSYKH